jgi:hypothetical protein
MTQTYYKLVNRSELFWTVFFILIHVYINIEPAAKYET